ncbi:MAG: NADH-quinone oxidoreductase subunit NuoE [Candidatus Sumerlaeota bacterium]|nr:NADH-quinone oxidoreductase subunit NuoE [Candidatus Sumerlaeota bacterium]
MARCPVQYKPVNGNGHYRAPVEIKPELKVSIDKAIEMRRHERAPLISVLQDINLEFRHLPPDGLKYIAQRLGIPLSRVYHVATFYTAFSLTPRGEHTIKVCVGTACHIRGAQRLVEALEERLQIKAGETTKDQKFTLETVNCLGACALSPVIVIDSKYFGNLTRSKLEKTLNRYMQG